MYFYLTILLRHETSNLVGLFQQLLNLTKPKRSELQLHLFINHQRPRGLQEHFVKGGGRKSRPPSFNPSFKKKNIKHCFGYFHGAIYLWRLVWQYLQKKNISWIYNKGHRKRTISVPRLSSSFATQRKKDIHLFLYV